MEVDNRLFREIRMMMRSVWDSTVESSSQSERYAERTDDLVWTQASAGG
jgi:hypothetical protein